MSGDVRPVVRTITQAQLHAYADASGDHNLIHIDEMFARSTPFGGTIAHGMLVLALIGEMMHGSFGRAWLESGRLKVRFKAPARPGVTATVSVTLTRDAEGAREYNVQCVNDRGETLIEGRASVRAGAS